MRTRAMTGTRCAIHGTLINSSDNEKPRHMMELVLSLLWTVSGQWGQSGQWLDPATDRKHEHGRAEKWSELTVGSSDFLV